jgi:NAD(P)H-hydrate repair Nnr-like enzyme with NAD(P)H-hydrate dehydratase domain
LTPIDAAKLGTFVHGIAGEMGAQQKGQLSLIASDVTELLPVAFERIRNAWRAP